MILKEELDRFELTDGGILGIMTDNVSSNNLMTWSLQSTFQASRIKWPLLRNHIPCMAKVIQHAFGAFISSGGVNGRSKS